MVFPRQINTSTRTSFIVSTCNSTSTSRMLVVAVVAGVLASAGILGIFCQQRNEIRQLKETIARREAEEEEEKDVKEDDMNRCSSDTTDGEVAVVPIGTIRSVFKLCVGTPRQGLLTPNSRGVIQIDPAVLASDCIVGLEDFSHLWVVFLFHLNTNQEKVRGSQTKKKNRMFPSKVSPPALGGARVGIFTTRTPHRFNPIGFSLCKLDHVDLILNRLRVSGIDLVDGTPILDIKPFVPHYGE